MNWKEHVNLFCNGKFKMEMLGGQSFNRIRSYSPITNRIYFLHVKQSVHIDDCKLIARPLSDMLDQEKKEISEIISKSNSDWHQINGFLYLLSIGVYPFDDETDVIWRYENE